MTTLPSHSAKRLAEIKSGKVKVNGSFKRPSVEVVQKRATKARQQYYDAVFGPKKFPDAKESRKSAKAALWKQFSMFIRLRDTDENGRVACITCGTVRFWRQMDAGHYVTTKKEATKYDENNVHAQCKGCNKWQGGKPVEYEAAIDRRYGPGTAQKIREKSVRECKRETWHYRALAIDYLLRVNNIKARSPGKFFGDNDAVQLLSA